MAFHKFLEGASTVWLQDKPFVSAGEIHFAGNEWKIAMKIQKYGESTYRLTITDEVLTRTNHHRYQKVGMLQKTMANYLGLHETTMQQISCSINLVWPEHGPFEFDFEKIAKALQINLQSTEPTGQALASGIVSNNGVQWTRNNGVRRTSSNSKFTCHKDNDLFIDISLPIADAEVEHEVEFKEGIIFKSKQVKIERNQTNQLWKAEGSRLILPFNKRPSPLSGRGRNRAYHYDYDYAFDCLTISASPLNLDAERKAINLIQGLAEALSPSEGPIGQGPYR